MYDNYKKAFWIGLAIPAIQQLTGINAIMYYAPIIFKGNDNERAKIAMVLYFITMVDNFVFTLISTFISDKLGRRILFIGGSIGCGLSLLLAAFGAANQSQGALNIYVWIFAAGVYVFVAFFGLSHGPVW